MEEELLDLASKLEQMEKYVRSAKSKLSKLANDQHTRRAEAERQAMFLEDCIGHAPPQLLNHFSGPMSDISKEQAHAELIEIMENPPSPQEYALLIKKQVESMMEQIDKQHELCLAEKEQLSKLRQAEIESKQREDDLYNTVMQKVHEISDEFNILRKQNKSKKWQLGKLQSANSDLQKCVEQANKSLKQSQLSLTTMKQKLEDLTARKQQSQKKVSELQSLQEKIDSLKQRNSELREQEEEMTESVEELASQCTKKREELATILLQIRQEQSEIDQITPKQPEKEPVKLTPMSRKRTPRDRGNESDGIMQRYSSEMKEIMDLSD